MSYRFQGHAGRYSTLSISEMIQDRHMLAYYRPLIESDVWFIELYLCQ